MSDFYNESERRAPQTVGEWVRTANPYQIIREMYRQYGEKNMRTILRESKDIVRQNNRLLKMCGFRR